MTIPRNLGNLAPGANSSGVLDTTKGGTGLTTVGTNGQVLQSNGSALVFATPTTTSPAGSTGQVQYNNAGAFGAVSAGTSGQVLTSAGSGAVPTWATPSAGAMTLIGTQTGGVNANPATWTGLSGYKNYLIVFQTKYSSNSDILAMQLGYGSTTYLTSNYYSLASYSQFQSATSNSGGVRNGSYLPIDEYLTNTGDTIIAGYIYLQGCNDTTRYPSFQSFLNHTGLSYNFPKTITASGICGTSGNIITAINFYLVNGNNFDFSTFSLYGIST